MTKLRCAKICKVLCPSVWVALQNLTASRLPGFPGFVLKGMGWEQSHRFAPKQKQKLGCFSQMWSKRFGWAPGAFALEIILIQQFWGFKVAFVQRNIHYPKSLTKNYNSNLRSLRSKKGQVAMQGVHFQSQQPRGWVTSEDLGSLITNRSSVDCILYLINQVSVQPL